MKFRTRLALHYRHTFSSVSTLVVQVEGADVPWSDVQNIPTGRSPVVRRYYFLGLLLRYLFLVNEVGLRWAWRVVLLVTGARMVWVVPVIHVGLVFLVAMEAEPGRAFPVATH